MLALMADMHHYTEIILPQQRMCSYAYMIQMPMPERVSQEGYIPAHNHRTHSVNSIPTEILLALKFRFPHQGCQYREAQDIVWQAIQLFCLLCPVVSHHLSFWNLPFSISADIVFNLLWQCVL